MSKRTWSTIPEDEIIEAIEKVAQSIDADGNQGIYAHSIPESWVLKPYFKKYRDGILYFNTGRGWRVRKNPHWRDVLNERKEKRRPSSNWWEDIPV